MPDGVRIPLAVAAFIGCVAPVFAHPPDDPFAAWYSGLKQPGTGISCCSMLDCRPVVTRMRDGRLEAYVSPHDFPGGKDEWVIVPDARVLRGQPNPLGEPVLCWAGDVRCFVPAGGF